MEKTYTFIDTNFDIWINQGMFILRSLTSNKYKFTNQRTVKDFGNIKNLTAQ
jgi:hypothetical protein